MNTEQLLDDAMAELSSRNLDQSIKLCNLLLSESPEPNEEIACRIVRATAYELTESGDRGLSLSSAAKDYSFLVDNIDYAVLSNDFDHAKTIGHAGLARVLYLQDSESNAETIKMHCDAAIELENHVPSMLLAGVIVRDHYSNDKLSRGYFFKAAKARDYWGLKYLVRSLIIKFGWFSIVGVVPAFYLLVPFFKKRDHPFDE